MVATLKRPKKKTHPDLRIVSAQHNEGPSDDTILVFAGQLIEARADMQALRAKAKKIKQRATNAGITIAELDEAINLSDMGTDAVAARFKRLIRYSKALGAPIGTQLSFFTDPQGSGMSFEDELKKAFDSGRILSLLGQDVDEQAYPSHTPLGQEHLKGWQDGQKVRYEQLTRNSEEEAARVKKAQEEKEAKAAKKANSAKGKAETAVREAVATLDEPEDVQTADDEIV